MSEFKQGDKIKLSRRRLPDNCRILGQGNPQSGLYISQDGDYLFIPADQVLQVSEDENMKLGDMQAEPMPRISTEVVNNKDFNHRFTKVE
jgi:hypothetical protein